MVEIIKLIEISENYMVEKDCEITEGIILGPLIFRGLKEDKEWSQLRYGEALEGEKEHQETAKASKPKLETVLSSQLHGQMHRMQDWEVYHVCLALFSQSLLKSSWTKDPTFSVCIGPCKLCSWSWFQKWRLV